MPFIRPGIPHQPSPAPLPGLPAQPAGDKQPGGAKQLLAGAAAAQPCGSSVGIGGMMLGLGPQTLRVKAGDSLTSIGKAQLPPGSSAAKLALWIEQAKQINKLGADGLIKPGQPLFLPSLFLLETAGSGKASPMLSFAEGLDAEKIMAAQEQHAESLSNQLKAVNVEQRLSHYQASPPPSPEPADLQWMQKLNAAKHNPLLKHQPAPAELALQAALEKAIAWKQMLAQPLRLTRADLKQLPAAAQQQLNSLMATDGKADDLSALDLTKASPAAVKQLIQTLKQGGYQPHEQRLVQVLADLSDSLNIFSQSSYSFIDDKAPHLSRQHKSHELSRPESEAYQKNLKEIRQLLSDPELIQRGSWQIEAGGKRLLSLDASKNTLKEFDLAGSARMSERARSRLEETYGFRPGNPFDLKAVKAMASKLTTPEAKTDFIQQYLSAFYVHPGEGTAWSLATHLSEALGQTDALFFGNPPALDRLPDGRCLMDCEGFAKLSQVLLDHLEPGNRSLPVTVPGHIFTVAQLGDKFYVFDNGQRQSLELKPEEVKRFEDLYENFDSNWNRLDPFRRSPVMGREEFPGIYAYGDQRKALAPPESVRFYQGDFMSTRSRTNFINDVIR